MVIDKKLLEIDEALNHNDIKKAEVAIARLLRGNHSAQERAALHLRRARARLQGAKPDDALEDLQTGLALHPSLENAPDVKILRGDIHFARFELAPMGFADRSDTDNALQYYTEVAEGHPQMSWVDYQIGRIYLSQNEVEKADASFQRALTVVANPSDVHALTYERLGFIHFFEYRQPQTALEMFQQAVDHYPKNSDLGWLVQLYIRMSSAYLELGEHQKALEAARRALRQIQDGTSHRAALSEAHMAIADVLALMPDSEEEAIEHYIRFLQTSKRPPGIDVTWSQVNQNIGELSFRIGRYQQAINAYEKALEYNPYHPWEVNIRYQIARCHYRLRAYERAAEAIEKMEALAEEESIPITDWRVHNLLGNSYFALEEYAKAVEAYRKSIKLAPSNTESVEKMHIYLRFAEELTQSAP